MTPPDNLPVHQWDLSSSTLTDDLKARRTDFDAQRPALMNALRATLSHEQQEALYVLMDLTQQQSRAQGMLYLLEGNSVSSALIHTLPGVNTPDFKALENEKRQAQNNTAIQKKKVTGLQFSLNQAEARIRRLQQVNAARTVRFSVLLERLNRQELRLAGMIRRTTEDTYARPVFRERTLLPDMHPAPDPVNPGAVNPDPVNPGAVNPGAVNPGAVNPGAVNPDLVTQTQQVHDLIPTILERLELEGQFTTLTAIQAGLREDQRPFARQAVASLVASGQVHSTPEGVSLSGKERQRARIASIRGGPAGMSTPTRTAAEQPTPIS